MSRYTAKKEKLTTYEGGKQYKLPPMLNLKLITASSILGEPKFYKQNSDELFKLTSDAVDKALDYDFKATLDFAVQLRTVYNMRLNPNFILIRALLHKNRQEFNKNNPKVMMNALDQITLIPSDIKDQYDLYTFIKGDINGLPTLLKRSWAKKLASYSKYTLKKYKEKAKIINLVRLSHANSEYINELMETGDVVVEDKDKTWETLHANGMKWADIIKQINIPHMALLRNLRGIIKEYDKAELSPDIKELCFKLIKGVVNGKQFPFRYYSAYNEIYKGFGDDNKNAEAVKNALSECMQESLKNLPRLKGRTVALSDNSGSAWGSYVSANSNIDIKDIDNISSLMAVMNSDSGKVVYFSDYYEHFNIKKDCNFFEQLRLMNASNVNGCTDNAVVYYLENAIIDNEHIDNLFCFTDDQSITTKRNVEAVINRYRKTVNPKINIFLVQTDGYANGTIPDGLERCAYLSGWTGKECLFASEMIKIWDEIDQDKNNKK